MFAAAIKSIRTSRVGLAAFIARIKDEFPDGSDTIPDPDFIAQEAVMG
jgi:hypothetical protein